jgi:arylsulfatase A-like enzyme
MNTTAVSTHPSNAPVPLQAEGRLQRVFAGSLVGLRAWMIYAVIEGVFAYLIPTLWDPENQLMNWQWRLLGAVLATYVLAGIVLGAAGGAILRTTDRSKLEAFAGVALALAFIANLARSGSLGRSEIFAIAITGALCIALLCALVSDTWRARTRWLANPWLAAMLMLASPWIALDGLRYSSGAVKTTASILAIAATLAAGYMWSRLGNGRTAGFATVGAALGALSLAGAVHGMGRPALISPATQAAAARPNIILISMDTVRADHLSIYGYARNTSPSLSEFAERATLYTRAIAASDITLSSHASMFTGLYPSWHGAYPVMPDFPYGRPLGKSVTLAEILREHGYSTAGVVANHAFLQASMGLSQGFSVWDHRVPMRLSTEHLPFYLREAARDVLGLVMDTSAFDAYCMRADGVNREAEALLSGATHEHPFFLFLNYMDAHTPYVPPSPFRDLFPGRNPRFRPAASHENLTFAVNLRQQRVTEAQKRDLISQYDGGIAYLDSRLGELFEWLRKAGLYDNSLIIVTSDHGEAFGERDLMQHAEGFVYQNQVHVPLLVKFPGQHEPVQSAELVSHVDLMPTILDAAGIAPPANLPGRSLRSPADPARVVFSEGRFLSDDETFRLRGVRRAIYVGWSKLIVWSVGSVELYDLNNDPNELHNEYPADLANAAPLVERLTRWIGTIPHRLPPAPKPDQSTLERIKSLGYAQ